MAALARAGYLADVRPCVGAGASAPWDGFNTPGAYLDAVHHHAKPSRGVGKLKFRLSVPPAEPGHALYYMPPFLEWSRAASNLQARSMLYGAGDTFVVGETTSRYWWGKDTLPAMSESAYARLAQALTDDFDVVAPLSTSVGTR